MKVTAGGGGAFLSTTQELDEYLKVPAPKSDNDPTTEEKDTFKLQHCYPEKNQSRRLNGLIFLLGLRNPWFTAIPAGLYMLLFLASLGDGFASSFLDVLQHQLRAAPLAIIVAVATLASAFYIVPKRVSIWPSRIFRGLAGTAQTLCHVVALAVIATACADLLQRPLTGWWLIPAIVLVGMAGAVVGSIVFAAFLFLMFTLFGWNRTEAFSSFRYSGYKNFLRMHITKTAVTIYPIGIDKISTQWDFEPEPKNGSAEASWLKPKAGTIETRLIEKEFTILAPQPSQ
jgi:hypothetical protein